MRGLTSIEKQVLITLAYTDQFSFPLTTEEVWARLVAGESGAGLTQNQVAKILHKLLEKKLVVAGVVSLVGVVRPDGVVNSTSVGSIQADKSQSMSVVENTEAFALVGGKSFFKERMKKAETATKKWLEVQKLVERVGWIPWIEAIFVTGSLAMNSVEPESDCDFMMVTQKNRLWLTRILVVGIAWLSGRRRSWSGESLSEKSHSAARLQDSGKKHSVFLEVAQLLLRHTSPFFSSNPSAFRKKGTFRTGSEEKNSWCFNLWLDAQHLRVPDERHSTYTAYEVFQAVPVLERQETVKKYWRENAWISAFLPNSQLAKNPAISHPFHLTPFLQPITEPLFDMLEWLSWKFQIWYMRPHRTSEKIDKGFAFFHPRDTEGIIEKGWQHSLKKIPGWKVVLVTGVFDILHKEHLKFLKKARQLGDSLVIGIESDVRVRQLKGEGRPINAQDVRRKNLAKLKRKTKENSIPLAERVFVLPENFSTQADHEQLIESIHPAFLAVSSHTLHLKEKRKIIEKFGGKLAVVLEQNPKISTTQILKKHSAARLQASGKT